MSQRLASKDPVLETIRASFETMEGAMADAKLPFRISLKKGAFRAGKVRGDRLTMTPTADEMKNALRQAFGSPKIEMAYAQRGDVLYMAMGPAKVDLYLKRALSAAGGKDPLGASKSTTALMRAHAEDSMIVAVSLAHVLTWMRDIELIEPPGFGTSVQHDDVVLSMRTTGERQREVVFDLSPGVLETVYRMQGL